MAIRMTKPWTPLTAENVARLTGQLGVYQLADAGDAILYVGYAGGRSLFGLRGELQKQLVENRDHATQFRVEINQQYSTRWRELLMTHVADHGALPPRNETDHPVRLGRLSPL